jgi:hypothetical protein
MLQAPGRGRLPLPVPCLAWREPLLARYVNVLNQREMNAAGKMYQRPGTLLLQIWRAWAVAGDDETDRRPGGQSL